MKQKLIFSFVLIMSVVLGAGIAPAQGVNNTSRAGCNALPPWDELQVALKMARAKDNGGLNLDMWGTVVHGCQPRKPVARQPCDFGSKSEHGKCVQPA
jgi:hypothetical protein